MASPGSVVSLVKEAYKATVPSAVRQRVWRMRRRIPRRWHDLMWTMGDEARLSAWADERLALGPWYWLFVVGCNNSGTTLLVETLQSHELIRSLPKEGQRITTAIPNSASFGIGRVFSQRIDLFRRTEADDDACVPRLRYDWAYFADPKPGIRLEKSPPNTLRSRWLQRWFAPARFIVLVRNPYAVCEGIARRRGHSIAEAAEHWRVVHETLDQDMPHLERCLVVRYEEFCTKTLDVLRQVQDFLGLDHPFDTSLATRQFKAHNMSGRPQQLQDFNERSLRRLSDGDKAIITHIAGSRMIGWGYQPL